MIPALEELRSRLQSLKDPYGNRAKSMSISDVIQMTFKIEQEYQSYYKPLTTGDVSKLLHVHLRTVLQWISEGKLKAYRTPGRHCRITSSDFNEFLKKYNIPLTR